MTHGRRWLAIALCVVVVGVLFESWIDLVESIERAANRSIAKAESMIGRVFLESGAVSVVARHPSRLAVLEGSEFRFEAPEAVSRIRVDLELDAAVSEIRFAFDAKRAKAAGAGVLLRTFPDEGFATGFARESSATIEDLQTRKAPNPAPTGESATFELALRGSLLEARIDGELVASAPFPGDDLRETSLRAIGGSLFLLRGDLESTRGDETWKDSFDALPSASADASSVRASLHFGLACVAILLIVLWWSRRGVVTSGLAVAATIFAVIFLALGVVHARGGLGAPLPVTRERVAGVVPGAIEESIHLHAGNARRLDGAFRDFRLDLRFATNWNGSLEVRMRGDSEAGADHVVFRIATDPRLRTGFFGRDAASGRATPLGFDIEAYEPNRLLDVTILADGSLLRAYAVDRIASAEEQARQESQPIAEAFVPTAYDGSGPLVLRAIRGSMRVDRFAVSELPDVPARAVLLGDPTRMEQRSRERFVLGIWLALALLVVALRRGNSRNETAWATIPAIAAVLPAVVAAIDPPLPLGPGGAIVSFLPALVAAMVGVLVAWRRNTSLTLKSGVFLAALGTVGLALTRQPIDPFGSPLLIGDDLDFDGRAFEPDLVLDRHSRARREVSWLRDHRLHGEALEPRREGDPFRVMLLGESRTMALDASPTSRSALATQLERGIEFGVGARGAQVIDATWEDASLLGVLAFLDEVLLRPRGVSNSASLRFAPDVALVVLPIEAYREARSGALERAATFGSFRSIADLTRLDLERVAGRDLPDQSDSKALIARLARLAFSAKEAGTRIVLLIPPREGRVFLSPLLIGPEGGIDLLIPRVPSVSVGAPTYRDEAVLAPRGRRLAGEQIAHYLRKRCLGGSGS